ncbi:MAG: aldehyde ferredoxin oxidoreductase N-terminal domain-containing protein, partial [Thermodesulfobacteriota bacterium]
MTPKRKIARIDLGKNRIDVEEIPTDLRLRFLGGRGLGAYLLFKSLPKGCDPLKPGNCLVFSTGLLGGTGAGPFEYGGVAGKSPSTQTISFSP